jgi:putative radical SAM enzyme (TIGR03279 family)
MPGLIQSIDPQGAAAQAGLRPGDLLASINGHPLRDVIDAQFYGADDILDLAWERDGAPGWARVRRAYGQPLGVAFAHPTFDIDIRRCNNLCPFCFVLQNAPRMRRTLYIKDDDYRYSFLFGHFVTLTNLSQEDWDRLAEQRLSPLYVSVHATDVDVRRHCLRNASAPDVLAQLRWLAEHGIQTHTQLVITPGLNDGAHAEKSVLDLASLHPQVLSVSVVPVGLTRHHKYGHRTHTPVEAAAMLDTLHGWQRALKARLGARFVHATDEWYLACGRRVPPKSRYEGLALQENGLGMTRDFLDEWARLKRKELRTAPAERAFRHPSAVLATAALFAPTLAEVAREFTALSGIPLAVAPIRNERLGDTITVAGLLTGRDVIAQLSARPIDPAALVVLPRIMFDHPDGVALDDVSPADIARAIGRTVALADWMGDVLDALAGKSRLIFDPGSPEAQEPVAREGGWTVEKYL